MNASPFFALFTNFDAESGSHDYPEWQSRELIVVRLKGQGDDGLANPKIMCTKEATIVSEKGRALSSYQGDLTEELAGHAYESFLLEVTVTDIDAVIREADSYLIGSLGSFRKGDSPLGQWFLDSREKVLTEGAKTQLIEQGWHNYLVSLLNAPFSIALLQGSISNVVDHSEVVISAIKQPIQVIKKAD